MKRFGIGVTALLLALTVLGCNPWEKTTYQTLNASKAVIDQAHQDYEHGVIPVNSCSFTLINQATAADALVVTGFETYEQEKKANAAATVLADQQAVVEGLLTQLAPLISDIALMKTNPIAACAGVKAAPLPPGASIQINNGAVLVAELAPPTVPVDSSKPYTCKDGWTKVEGGCTRQTSDGCNTTTWTDNGFSTWGVSTAVACRETQTALVQGGKQ